MNFDHVLGVLKLLVTSVSGVVKKAKEPVTAVRSSATLAVNGGLDSRDIAIICLGIALVFSTLAVLSLAAARR